MRIYNGKNSQVDLPLSGNTRVTIAPHSVSKDIMPSDYFLTLVAQSYEASELALIVAGPYEINMCAKNPACTPMIVQSLDEAIERFNKVSVTLDPVEIKPVEVKPIEVVSTEVKPVEILNENKEKEEESLANNELNVVYTVDKKEENESIKYEEKPIKEEIIQKKFKSKKFKK